MYIDGRFKEKRVRIRKILSLLLAIAVAFTMNSTAFAEEILEEAELEQDESAYTLGTTNSEDGIRYPTGLGVDPLVIDEISENILSMRENLSEKSVKVISENGWTYVFVHDRAIGYKGKKILPNDIDLRVYFKKGVVSQDDLQFLKHGYINEERKARQLGVITKLKSSKGATVNIKGEGTVPAKDSTYISGIKLTGRYREYYGEYQKEIEYHYLPKWQLKEIQKALDAYIKEEVKKLKKGKNFKISANGLIEGSDNEEDRCELAVAVYPMFVGNCYYKGELQNLDFSVVVSSIRVADYSTDLSGNTVVKYESPYGNWVDEITSTSIGDGKHSPDICTDTFKIKNGKINSVKAYYKYEIIIKKYAGNRSDETKTKTKTKIKKFTLKPTKNQKKKSTGLASDTGEAITYTDQYNGSKYEVNKVNADGNFFGYILYPSDIPKGNVTKKDQKNK